MEDKGTDRGVISTIASPEFREWENPLLCDLLLHARVCIRDRNDIPEGRQRDKYFEAPVNECPIAKDLDYRIRKAR
jgi:hypothetical protein